MIRKVTSWLLESRIRWNYSSYERRCREEHQAEADSRYPVGILASRIKRLKGDAVRKGDVAFGDQLSAAKCKRASLSLHLTNVRRQLDLIRRDFDSDLRQVKATLDSKHAAKIAIRREMQENQRGKNHAAREINNWHASTKDWMGNRYRDIPQSSFFGRSWSELDQRKDDYEEWAEESIAISEKLVDANDEILKLEDHRNELFRGQNEKRELLRRGVTATTLKRAVELALSDIAFIDQNLRATEVRRAEVIRSTQIELGIAEVKARYDEMTSERQTFLARFDEEDPQTLRRAAHRESWMEERKKRSGRT